MSDGSPNGAVLLKDIFPGNRNGIITSFAKSSVIHNDILYFVANDGTSEGEIWRTDGTRSGTRKITNLNFAIQKLTLINDYFYFVIKRGDALQVWRSNGVSEVKIKDNIPAWSLPSFETELNENYIFTFRPEGSNHSAMWRSDGTESGTYVLFSDIEGNGAGVNGDGSPVPSQYIEYHNELFFFSRHFMHKTDGSTTTDIMEVDYPSLYFIYYGDAIEINNLLYFSFYALNNTRLIIWESDGTKNGTKSIYDEYSTKYFMTSNLASWNNQLVFIGPNQNEGTSLLVMDLQDYTIDEIKEIDEEPQQPFIISPGRIACNIEHTSNGLFFISALDGDFDSKGWISQLTDVSTLLIEPLRRVRDVFVYNGLFYFGILTNDFGTEFGRSDGTEANTVMLDNINPFYSGLVSTSLVVVNSKLLFNANDGIIGMELWSYDGTNLVNIMDIWPGYWHSFPKEIHPFNNYAYLNASDPDNGSELWRTDGTTEGTQLIQDIWPGNSSSNPAFFRDYKGEVYFIAVIDDHSHLCKTNGINVDVIKNIGDNDFGLPLDVNEMIVSGSFIYIITKGGGGDLYISDGTEIGTYKMKDFYRADQLTDVDGRIFFAAAENIEDDIELWTSDGTVDGTLLLDDGQTGFSSEPRDLINYNGKLVYTAKDFWEGREVWTSNGTGVSQIMDFNPGMGNTVYHADFCELNGLLYFSGGYSSGIELYNTDAMSPYPTLIKDIRTGNESSSPSGLTRINNQIYFQAYTDANGVELWGTNGTPEGTKLIADILPGEWTSAPTNFVEFEGSIYFIAETHNNGRQIWKIPFEIIDSSEDLEAPIGIIIYPSPTHDILYIEADKEIEKIIIYNTLGQTVSMPEINDNAIDISNLNDGIYFIIFYMNGRSILKKMIKQ